MATVVETFGACEEVCVFSGSSEDDMAFAKTFWQSVQLLPAMESRLVSSDIKQRLKAAPPGHQPVNAFHQLDDIVSEETSKFLAKAEEMTRAEQRKRLENYALLREEDLKLLAKRRAERMEKEKFSNHKGLPQKTSTDPQQQSSELATSEKSEAQAEMKALELFDRRLGQQDEESDGD